MYTAQFWREAFERAAKTGVQAVLLFLGAGATLDVVTVDWGAAASFAVGGVVLSLLTSIASAPLATKGTASLVKRQPQE